MAEETAAVRQEYDVAADMSAPPAGTLWERWT